MAVDVDCQRLKLENSAGIAQLVERNLAKVEVASSNLVSRSTPSHRYPDIYQLQLLRWR